MSEKEYEVVKNIGKGAYGSVDLVKYKGQYAALKKQCIKDETILDVCNNEIDVLKKLHNRYVIHYYDSFREKRNMCILMEFCPNKSLHDLTEYFSERNQFLSNDGVLKYFCEMVIGLQYLHSHNILHRDLKPDNIFITKDNVCVLADFGLSKELDDINALNATMAGTPLYMAPEVLNNEKYTYKAEIWSLGCILHELCSLHPLYCEAKSHAGLRILQNTPYDQLKLKYPLPQHINKEIRNIIKMCLNVNPNERPTMNELYNQPIVQEFINQTGKSLLFEYDTISDDNKFDDNINDSINDIPADLVVLLDELSKSLDIIENKSDLIIKILEYYKDKDVIDKQEECSIFKLIQHVSAYIGRILLKNPHCEEPKFEYYCIDTYDRKNKNLKKGFVINIIDSIIIFLRRHSFRDEANAIYEGLKNEKPINADIISRWEELFIGK